MVPGKLLDSRLRENDGVGVQTLIGGPRRSGGEIRTGRPNLAGICEVAIRRTRTICDSTLRC